MNPNMPLPWGSQIWPRIGAGIAVCVVLYYGFVALNTLGLPNQTGVATVLDKAYYPPGKSYETLNIGGRTFIRPYDTVETYGLKLRLNDQETAASVDKSLYDRLSPKAEVQVTYQRCRLTGAVQVVNVTLPGPTGGR